MTLDIIRVHAETSEKVRRVGYTWASVARFPELTTASVNRMHNLKEITELDAWDK